MKLWVVPRRATQDVQVIVKNSDKTWSTGGRNDKPLQYSCHENPTNRQKDMTPEDEPPRSEGVQYAQLQKEWSSWARVETMPNCECVRWWQNPRNYVIPRFSRLENNVDGIVTNCKGKYRKRFPGQAYDSQGKKRQTDGQTDGETNRWIHFKKRKWKWKSLSHVRLCDLMDYIVHGILQARILEWVAFPYSRDLPNPGIEPRSNPVLHVESLPVEPQGKAKNTGVGSLSLLLGIFLTQESNRGLLHCR